MLPLLMELGAVSGWLLAYLLIIRRAWLDKVTGMPIQALLCNFAWELSFVFLHPTCTSLQLLFVLSCLLPDCVILGQAICYRKNDQTPASAWFKYANRLLWLGVFAIGAYYLPQLRESATHMESNFWINLLMSAAFPLMLLRRKSIAGQSFWIAFFKMTGTLFGFAYAFLYVPADAAAGMILCPLIILLDLLYCLLLWRKCEQEGISPLSRY